jgi:hypothetical protein
VPFNGSPSMFLSSGVRRLVHRYQEIPLHMDEIAQAGKGMGLSEVKQRKRLRREEEEAEAKRTEQLKEEGAIGKAAVKSQTKPSRNKAD